MTEEGSLTAEPVYKITLDLKFRNSNVIEKPISEFPNYIIQLSNIIIGSSVKQFCSSSKTTQKLKGEVNEIKLVFTLENQVHEFLID